MVGMERYEMVPCICGKQARVVVCGVGSYISCPSCGAGTYMKPTKREALMLWEKIKSEAESQKEEIMGIEERNIVYIGVDHIHTHPENPRKELGDLTELAESLKKNGCLQNLTVVPIEGKAGEYYALIGNRRHGAAQMAGLTELPCRIVEGMSQREQLSTMLEENMQRNDLTIYEQAQGFQLMLDLGETEDSIAEKTGFSKTTIRHRLNIAKLDQKELQKKEKDDSFQLTLKDLYELEKVKDVKVRNKILKEANSSRDLVSRAQSAVSEAKRAENSKIIAGMLKKLGVKKAPKEVENEQWTGKWKTVKEFELDKEVPKQIKLPKEKEEMMYVIWYRSLKVIVKAPKEKRQLSEYELAQKERDKKKKRIKAILRESSARRKEFIENIISGKIDAVRDEGKVKDAIWQALIALGAYAYGSTLRRFFLSKDEYQHTAEERQEAQKKADALSTLHQMMIVLNDTMKSTNETYDWQGRFNPEKGSALLKGYEALEPYGWYFESEDEKKVLDGTHELYAKDEEKNE